MPVHLILRSNGSYFAESFLSRRESIELSYLDLDEISVMPCSLTERKNIHIILS